MVFCGCRSLRTVSFPDGLQEIGLRAFEDSGLESVTLPSSVRVIRQGAFRKCRRLGIAVLNEGLEVLGTDENQNGDQYGVFEESSLSTITLPSTLRRIECSAFRNC